MRQAWNEVADVEEAFLQELGQQDDAFGSSAGSTRKEFRIGEALKGVIRDMEAPQGVFVDLGSGREGFLPCSRMRGGPVNDPSDAHFLGERVKVWVHSTDDSGGVGLTMLGPPGGVAAPRRARAGRRSQPPSQAEPARFTRRREAKKVVRKSVLPGRNLIHFEDLPLDQWFSGVIRRVEKYGLFVDVKHPTLDVTARGLVHISKVRGDFVEDLSKLPGVELGASVRCRVIDVDVGTQHVTLSMMQPRYAGGGARQPSARQSLSEFADTGPDCWLEGTVNRTTTFGVFVDVPSPVSGTMARGLVLLKDIPGARGKKPAEILEVGELVMVRVADTDQKRSRLTLSMRDPDRDRRS